MLSIKLNFAQFHLPQLSPKFCFIYISTIVTGQGSQWVHRDGRMKGEVTLKKCGRWSRHTCVYWRNKKPHRVREEFDFTRLAIRTHVWAESGIRCFFLERFLTENGYLEFLRNAIMPETEGHKETWRGRNVLKWEPYPGWRVTWGRHCCPEAGSWLFSWDGRCE